MNLPFKVICIKNTTYDSYNKRIIEQDIELYKIYDVVITGTSYYYKLHNQQRYFPVELFSTLQEYRNNLIKEILE